jgi:hypothetical protein
MPISAKPYRQKTFATVKGKRMAYVEHGSGDAIVLCVLIACDLIGMGDARELRSKVTRDLRLGINSLLEN